LFQYFNSVHGGTPRERASERVRESERERARNCRRKGGLLPDTVGVSRPELTKVVGVEEGEEGEGRGGVEEEEERRRRCIPQRRKEQEEETENDR
jgi:hypothetical protein